MLRAESCGKALIGVALASLTAGCSTPERRPDFASIDPAERSLAVVEAAEDPEPSDVRELVEALESSDPAERMLASRALERLTGRDFGYRHFDPEPVRRRAVDRWEAWVRAGGPASADWSPPSAPAEESGTGPGGAVGGGG